MEQWKDIEGYDWVYQISNLGRVRSLKFWKEKILKWWTMQWWYTSMIFIKNKITKMNIVSRLVARYFIPNPNNYPYVLHRKEELINWRLDNSETNLYWWNQSQNMKDMFSKSRWNQCWLKRNPRKNNVIKIIDSPLWKSVRQYTKDWEFIKEWISIRSIVKELWFSTAPISKCCNWKQKLYNGFIWKFN